MQERTSQWRSLRAERDEEIISHEQRLFDNYERRRIQPGHLGPEARLFELTAWEAEIIGYAIRGRLRELVGEREMPGPYTKALQGLRETFLV